MQKSIINFGDRRRYFLYWPPHSPTTFCDYFGGGRLRLRYPHTVGMDYPYRWRTACVTLSSGQTYTYYMGPSSNPSDPILSDVEFMKVAIWWYEPNTGPGTNKAQISSKVCRSFESYTKCDLRYSNDDNKMQYVYDSVYDWFDDVDSGRTHWLTIEADYIPSGETRYVCYNFLWEDLDRDDANGPCYYNCPQDDPEYLFFR